MDTEPLRNSQLHSPHGPSRTHERGRQCGEQNSTLALEKEVPPEYPQVHAWMLASPPLLLVASDTPSPRQLWAPITLSQSNGGPHATRGCKPPPCLWGGKMSPLHYAFPQAPPQPHSLCLSSDSNSAPVVLSHKHASESPGGPLTSQKMVVPVCHRCPPSLSTLPLPTELVSLAAMLWINLTPYLTWAPDPRPSLCTLVHVPHLRALSPQHPQL